MRVKSLKPFVRLLLFVVLLGASSTAYADTVAITTYGISNLQFTAATGTAVFTLTGASARAQAQNSSGQIVDNISNAFPLAVATANVNFASATGTANAAGVSISGTSSASIGGCTCVASAFTVVTLTGTLVVVGAEGMVEVNISGLETLLNDLQTDQFGVRAESEILFNMHVNGPPVFSLQVERLLPLSGPNLRALIFGVEQVSGTIRVQAGAENSIFIVLTTGSFVESEVPEPATIVLLVSGLGFMTGVLKKRRDR